MLTGLRTQRGSSVLLDSPTRQARVEAKSASSLRSISRLNNSSVRRRVVGASRFPPARDVVSVCVVRQAASFRWIFLFLASKAHLGLPRRELYSKLLLQRKRRNKCLLPR